MHKVPLKRTTGRLQNYRTVPKYVVSHANLFHIWHPSNSICFHSRNSNTVTIEQVVYGSCNCIIVVEHNSHTPVLAIN